jgi:hypothetical protein
MLRYGIPAFLFTMYMYQNLGIHWASCIPAFLAVACVPFPFLFYRYGHVVRRKCKYAAEADDFIRSLAQKARDPNVDDDKEAEVEAEAVANQGDVPETFNFADEDSFSSRSSLERTETAYDANPYDIDHVNTRNSAITQRSRSTQGRRHRLFGFGGK